MAKRGAFRAASSARHGAGNRHAARSKHGVRQTRFTRVRAVLAGALVLGVGGTLTLAAWTDTEYATGQFAASTFGIVGSTNGTDFGDHPTGAPGTLVFASSPGAMSPGVTTYSKFVVKTTPATNVAGTVMLSGATVIGGLGTHLRYGVRVIPVASACNQTSFNAGTTVVATNSALTDGATAVQTMAVAGGNPVAYCFGVTLPAGTPNAAQGQTATATWVFTATSTS